MTTLHQIIESKVEELRKKFGLMLPELMQCHGYVGKFEDIEDFLRQSLHDVALATVEAVRDEGTRMHRPSWDEINKIGGYIYCNCGQVLQTKEATREHWQQGHFDVALQATKAEEFINSKK